MSLPVLVVMMGLPASGKSTLARALSAETGWPVVDRDIIRAAMFPRGLHSVAEKNAASDATLSALSVHLQQAQSCMADGKPYSRNVERQQLQALANQCGARCLWVWVDCPVDEAIRRVEADRQHPGRDGRAELVREVVARWEPVSADVLRLDATQPTAVMLAQLQAALSAFTSAAAK